MAECTCSSKAHGHGDVCHQPTRDNRDFCDACADQMNTDKRTFDDPTVARTDIPTAIKES
ncbi:MAG: hypothetical protein H0X25_09770 [Acidobacteriales bacterium]|nr:hypothetical protein [Terriglobales bacterium]